MSLAPRTSVNGSSMVARAALNSGTMRMHEVDPGWLLSYCGEVTHLFDFSIFIGLTGSMASPAFTWLENRCCATFHWIRGPKIMNSLDGHHDKNFIIVVRFCEIRYFPCLGFHLLSSSFLMCDDGFCPLHRPLPGGFYSSLLLSTWLAPSDHQNLSQNAASLDDPNLTELPFLCLNS